MKNKPSRALFNSLAYGVCCLLLSLLLAPLTSVAQSLPLGTFEQGGLIDLNPNEDRRHTRFLWHEVERGRTGVTTVTADAARTGGLGLHNVVSSDVNTNSSSQVHFYPNVKVNGVNDIRYITLLLSLALGRKIITIEFGFGF